tara:strand:+ start:470 stop:847 length:378 start_codon:yes stop_codon:yes gene_type:complete
MIKILIIDDEISLRKTIGEILIYKGYEVHEAENGQEGIKRVKEILPDLIICDIMMPVLDGYGFITEHIKTKYFKIPVLFISAKVSEEDHNKGILLGAKGYITKPFEFKTLISSIENNIIYRTIEV